MSFTSVQTPLYPLPESDERPDYINPRRNAHEAGARIEDPDGLRDALSDTLVEQMETKRVVTRDDYPGQEFEYLLGFTSFGREEDRTDGSTYHNIANHGFYYDVDRAVDHWATVSTFTEAFVFWTSPTENTFPDAFDVLNETDARVLRVEAEDGSVTAWELTFGVTETNDGWLAEATSESEWLDS